MKKYKTFAHAFLFTCLLGSFPIGTVFAVDSEEISTGTIRFEGQYEQQNVDPDNPSNPVDPGQSPSTTGELRIDFAPELYFGSHKTNGENLTYYANAQLLHNGLGARGNYVQISDYRGNSKGWTLQLAQEVQFQNEKKHSLDGAVLSFDKPWANSENGNKNAPLLSRDIIRLEKLNQTYQVAEATPGTGSGTWLISFGASGKAGGQTNTLVPIENKNGEPTLDPNYEDQQIFQNKAISLTIPNGAERKTGTYTTMLTWILSELP